MQTKPISEEVLPLRYFVRRNGVTFPRLGAGLTAFLGLAVLAGWALDIGWLKSVLPGAVQMKANTAVALLLAGSALFVLAGWPSPSLRWLGQALALVTTVLGLATLGEYVFGWQLHIDELLFRDTGNAYNLIRGRMSPYSAIAFAGIGFALTALHRPAMRLPVWLASALVTGIGALSVFGYLWNVSEVVSDRWLPPVAVHTAIAFILLGAGTLRTQWKSVRRQGRRPKMLARVEARIVGGFIGALLLLLVGGGYTYRHNVEFAEDLKWVVHTQEVRAALGDLYATIADSASAQRDYILTGEKVHRDNFARLSAATNKQLKMLERLVVDNAGQSQEAAALERLITQRAGVHAQTIDVFEKQGFTAARQQIVSGQGPDLTQSIRALIDRMDDAEAELLIEREAASAHVRRLILVSLLSTLALATAVFSLLFYGIRREILAREEAERFDATHSRMLSMFATTFSREQALRNMLEMLAVEHQYPACAFYSHVESDDRLLLEAQYGPFAVAPAQCRLGEGPVGEAAATGRTVSVTAEPIISQARDCDTATATQFILLACSVVYRERRFGVLTVAMNQPFSERERAFFEQMAAKLGVALNNITQYDEIRLLADQLRQRSEEITRKNVELERASQMKSEFLATMSHELRTPLNAIIGFAEVLGDGLVGELSAQQREHIGDILGSGEHLLALINDILDLSKVEAGRMELDPEVIVLRPLLVNALSMVKEKALAKRLRLTMGAADDLPNLWADARKLKQILYNLLSNAVKFTGEGGAVSVRAQRTASPGGEELELTVADNGIGIAEQDQARLFEPFVQIDSSISRNFQGTGLGLAMVKRLAELHGGRVALASEPGKGSAFTVWLPYRVALESTPEQPARTIARQSERAKALALVVEDDDKAAELLRLQLEDEGLEVIRARDAQAGLRLAREQQPNVITLDILLPGADGGHFLAALKADETVLAIPVVIISIVADQRRWLALGASHVLEKPVDRSALTAALAALGLASLPTRVETSQEN
jgi:signal transduction histidine kinase/ActR/RegA family two-component response regulator